jgi:hypothetical protein
MVSGAKPDDPVRQDDGGSLGSAPIRAAFGKARAQRAAYAEGKERPLGSYRVLMAVSVPESSACRALFAAAAKGCPNGSAWRTWS